jgi:RNA polymerase primary sigma factor
MKTFNDIFSIDVYLKDISKIPLMTPEIELETSTRLWDLKIKLDKLEASKAQLNGEKDKELDKKIEATNVQLQASKDKMVRCNCRLVVSIARRYQNQHLHLSDLIEEGNIGLMKAVDRFDPTRGFRFSTFAIWWIKQSIIKALKEKGSMIRIPMHISKEYTRYSRWVQEFKNFHGKEPNAQEVQTETLLNPARIELLTKIPRDFVSTHTLMGSSDREIGEMIVDEDGSHHPPEEAIRKSLAESLTKILDKLSDKEHQILEMRYGLKDKEPMVLYLIGKKMGITRERVRQIQASALKKLRKLSVGEELNLFLE